MEKQNNFKVFNETPTSSNTLNDAEYISNSHRKNGVVSGVADSKVHNKLFRQTSIMTVALANFITSQNLDALDKDVIGLTKNLSSALERISVIPLSDHRDKTTLDHPDYSVTENKLADNSVTTSKIKNKNVTNEKIADNAVGTTNIEDASVTTSKISDKNVTNKKLANNAVETAHIKDENVTTIKIKDKNVTMAKLADDVQDAINNVLQRAYPVGAIYMSTTSTAPSTLFGFGVWEALPGGRMLLAQGNGYSAGSQGGAATHTLTTAEMPRHNHFTNTQAAGNHTHDGTTATNGNHNHASWGDESDWAKRRWPYGIRDNNHKFVGSSAADDANPLYNTSTDGNHNHWFRTESAGSHTHVIPNDGEGKAHNNMPPYLAVYMWKRVR